MTLSLTLSEAPKAPRFFQFETSRKYLPPMDSCLPAVSLPWMSVVIFSTCRICLEFWSLQLNRSSLFFGVGPPEKNYNPLEKKYLLFPPPCQHLEKKNPVSSPIFPCQTLSWYTKESCFQLPNRTDSVLSSQSPSSSPNPIKTNRGIAIFDQGLLIATHGCVCILLRHFKNKSNYKISAINYQLPSMNY